MCGRFTSRKAAEAMAEYFRAAGIPTYIPRYNIAPTQPVLCVRPDEQGERQWASLRWGLVPPWAKDLKSAAHNINARSETVAEKPTFRDAFKKWRCLIPADGFYEWHGPAGHKQPYFFHLKDDSPFAFPGLWERWHRDGESLESCALLTTEANEVVKPIHNRMPVILAPEDFGQWLNDKTKPEELQALLRPFDAGRMAVRPVGKRVNNARNEGQACIEPAAEGG